MNNFECLFYSLLFAYVFLGIGYFIHVGITKLQEKVDEYEL